jgi:biopolymer transport protein ExbB
MKRILLTFPLALALVSLPALAQDAVEEAPEPSGPTEAQQALEAVDQNPTAPPPKPAKATSLNQLLELVRKGWKVERSEDKEREQRFIAAKSEQTSLLARSKASLKNEEDRSQALESRFQELEEALAERETLLTERLGSLGELFGVVRQVAGDTSGNFESSLTGSQIGQERREFLVTLGKSKELPGIEALEQLWYELSREMTEQGRVVRYTAPVLSAEGGEAEREVIRAGVFTAIADGEYLLWEPDVQKLRELNRQPPSIYLGTVAPFEANTEGMETLAIDPSKGSLLSVLIDTKGLLERIPEGGFVGYTIITLGVIAALLALWRIASVTITGRKVAAQQGRAQADPGNPLGRVLGVYEENRDVDPETLELKLDEAVMRESTKLERFIWLVKVVGVVAPLLGLLGTVTGMIRTFQAITLFGAGDPRMMAGGISEALVTTMLGLFTAIPLVLLHAALASGTKRITDVLDEQSAGIIARQSEKAARA